MKKLIPVGSWIFLDRVKISLLVKVTSRNYFEDWKPKLLRVLGQDRAPASAGMMGECSLRPAGVSWLHLQLLRLGVLRWPVACLK